VLTYRHGVFTLCGMLLTHAVQRQRLRRFLDEFSVQVYQSRDEVRLWFDVLDWPRYREHEPDWADGYLAVVSGIDSWVAVGACAGHLRLARTEQVIE
jgi:hypothetical protein